MHTALAVSLLAQSRISSVGGRVHQDERRCSYLGSELAMLLFHKLPSHEDWLATLQPFVKTA